MKKPNQPIVALVVALGLSASSSFGDTFDFSYTFGSESTDPGGIVAGSFQGTRAGDYVTGISDVVWSYTDGGLTSIRNSGPDGLLQHHRHSGRVLYA